MNENEQTNNRSKKGQSDVAPVETEEDHGPGYGTVWFLKFAAWADLVVGGFTAFFLWGRIAIGETSNEQPVRDVGSISYHAFTIVSGIYTYTTYNPIGIAIVIAILLLSLSFGALLFGIAEFTSKQLEANKKIGA